MMPAQRRILIIGLWLLVAVSAALLIWMRVMEPRLTARVGDAIGLGDYELVTTEGQPFTEETLQGQPSAVFFGFTHCPDVCPTTLGEATLWQEAMAERGHDLRTFFVTVDPERDDVEVLSEYVSWSPGIIGVTGSREEIDKAIKSFRIYARKVPVEGSDYTMDHSAMVLLFDENGRLFEPIGYGEDIKRATAKLERLFAS